MNSGSNLTRKRNFYETRVQKMLNELTLSEEHIKILKWSSDKNSGAMKWAYEKVCNELNELNIVENARKKLER